MANFLDDLSVYNAKAALVISQVVANGDTGKANMMSSLKSTANDATLSEAIRLNALTALINLGSLLDVPLPPYFPLTTTYADTQTYVGIHDDLTGIQGGAPGDYQHITTAERNIIANAATLGDISFTNLSGVYTDNANLVNAFAGKQNALSGAGFVKISGTTISYDNSTFLTTISGIAAGGELSGTYPNPALSNAAVISKLLTGFTGVALPTPITSSDTILSAMQKLNNNISSLIVSPSGVASVRLTTNSGGVFTTTTTPQTGASTLDVSLNSQSASTFLASPTSAAGVPTFRAFAATDLPNSGATAGTYGSSSFIPQIVVDAKGRITSISSVAAAAGGQVNTVTLTQPGIFTAATNIGTASAVNLNYGLSQQIANYVWAGPISGANATPTFRSLVAADIPNIAISQVTSLSSTLDGFLTDSLSDGSIWIGNTSNAAVQRVLSGDVTVSNTGVTAIGLAKVQYDMIQDVTTQTLLGRYAAVDGPVQQITLLGTDFVLDSGTGVLSLASPVAPVVTTKGDLLGHDLTVQQRVPSSNVDGDILLVNNSATGAYTDLGLNWVTMSGDATINATGAITIANAAVSLAKMANLPANRIIGNNTGSSATPLALTGTEVTAMLDLFSSSTGTKGLVPGSNGETTYFLRGDLSWQPITGTGTVTAVSITTANGFAGTSSGGATPALTIELNSLNGVLKGTGTAITPATAGTDFISPGQITQTSGAGSGLTMASGSLLGRTTASAGVIEAISVNSSLTLASTTLGLNLGNGNIFTVQQQMPSLRLNGATSGFVSFTPPAIAGAQVYELPAAVPSGSGQYLTATTGGVLSWSSPAGSGTTTNAATFNNSGSGAASGTTFDGSAARTISYNTLGAQQANTNLTGLSALTYASGTPFVKMTGAGTFSLDTNTYISGTATQYALLVGGAANSIASITPVVSNKLLISNGTSANPGWTDASYLATTTQYGILYSSATNVVSEILPPGTSGLFLQWTGSGYTWASGGGGGGSGTVTNVSVVSANGFIGSVANSTTTPAITLSTSITGILKGSSGALTAATPGVDYAPATSGTSILKGNGSGGFANATAGTDYLTSIGLTMPSAFTVTPATLTANGTFAVTGAGTASQYVRGDGTLALLPTAGGGGTAVSYYLNGSVASSVALYQQMSKIPAGGGAANFSVTNTTGFALVKQFVTDANDPSLLNIPAGAWDINLYFGVNNNSGSPQFYVELWKSDATGTTFTLISSGSGTPESITNGTTVDLYTTSISVSSTPLTITDRLVVRVYADTDGATRTVTLYTEGSRLAQIITTLSSGLTSLNGLNAQTQFFATPGTAGTAPAWTSTTATHTLNIPLASASSVTAGLISKTEYDTFNGKLANVLTTTGDIIYSSSGTTAARLGIGTLNQVLSVSSGGIPEWKTIAAGGDVTGPSSSLDGNFAVFDLLTGKIIKESTGASLTGGAAVFNTSVTVGVSGAAPTGQLIFRNSANAFTTTIQASTSATASATYNWPLAPATSAGQILANDGSGNLSWTAAGAGNVTTSGTGQVITGSIFFLSNLQVRDSGQTRNITLAAPTTGGTGSATITFPVLTGTVALLENTQTFTGAKTFQAGIALTTAGTFSSAVAATFSSSAASAATVTINPGVNSSLANPQLSITGSGGSNIQWMSFGAGSGAPPTAVGASGATRSAGTKIAASTAPNATSLDAAIGIETNAMWLSAGNSTQASVSTKFYVQSSTNTAIASVGQFENSSSCYGLNIPVHGTSGIASLLFSGTSATHQYIRFNGTGFADPALTASRSVGTRIILSGAGLTTLYDGAIGVSSTTAGFWFSTTGNYSFWSNNNVASTANNVLNLSGTAVLNLPLTTGRLQINGTQVVGPRTGTYGTPTNPNRANTWDSSTITATDANLRLVAGSLAGLIADLKTHGLIG